jgi:hypothetical protein
LIHEVIREKDGVQTLFIRVAVVAMQAIVSDADVCPGFPVAQRSLTNAAPETFEVVEEPQTLHDHCGATACAQKKSTIRSDYSGLTYTKAHVDKERYLRLKGVDFGILQGENAPRFGSSTMNKTIKESLAS